MKVLEVKATREILSQLIYQRESGKAISKSSPLVRTNLKHWPQKLPMQRDPNLIGADCGTIYAPGHCQKQYTATIC